MYKRCKKDGVEDSNCGFSIPFFGSSGILVGQNSLKAVILLGLRKIDFARFLWVDMEPLADVVCQPCSHQCLKSGLTGCQSDYHIALSI